MSRSRRFQALRAPPFVAAFALLCHACDGGIILSGGGDAADPLDGADAGGDGSPPDALDAAEEDSSERCPVWTAVSAGSGTPDGSRARPYVGLSQALARRAACEHVVLLAPPAGREFDARVDIEIGSFERLLVEGDPEAGARVPLAASAGSSGLRATGEGSLTLRRLALRGGAARRGGCLEAEVGELVLDDTEWSGCSADEDGGALAVTSPLIAVHGSRFVGNAAGRSGGALFLDGEAESTVVTVADCTFRENRADAGGGLIVAVATIDTLITRSRFVANSAVRRGSAVAGYLGGRIAENRFDRNVGGFEGGAVSGNAGWYLSEVVHNVFADNRVVGVWDVHTECCNPAPALDLEPADATIRNNLFLRNTAEAEPRSGWRGPGAVRILDGAQRIVNNTFVDNAGRLAHLAGGSVQIRNNIFAGGEGESGVYAWSNSGGPTVDWCNAWMARVRPYGVDTDVGPNNIFLDPLFVAPERDDYRLARGSPCVDAGDPATDQRDADGSRNDIGAFGGPAGDWTPLPEEE
ncbi:MAG: right-handed parallel beta-helix repeat-containing protein [Myxococcota bacterium]|nr:right-handed parallel beta-helix repeat-containing protein [Myxococcota bacterium]